MGAKPTIERTLDHTNHKQINIPFIVKFPEALDGLLFLTVQLYIPSFLPCTVKVLRYIALCRSVNIVLFPPKIVLESLVQVTVVAGPPVEIQVRVN